MKNYLTTILTTLLFLNIFNSIQGQEGILATLSNITTVSSFENPDAQFPHHPFAKDGSSMELLGSFSLGSFHYERPVHRKKNYFTNLKIGFGISLGLTLPHSFTFNFGKEKHYLEIGYQGTLGLLINLPENNDWSLTYIPSPLIGYRYNNESRFIRVYLAPLIGYRNQNTIWAGVGFGHYFKNTYH